MEEHMETNNATFKMIQWYPFPRVLPPTHPCSNSTRFAFRTKGYKVLTFRDLPSFQNLLNFNQDIATKETIFPLQPVENESKTIKDPGMLQNIPDASIDNNETKTLPEVFDPGSLFGPNERFKGDDLLSLDVSSIDDLVENLIPFGEISVIAGLGDTGKTTLYFQLSLSITTCKADFLGRKINSKFNSVLIIATEDSRFRIASKIQKQLKKIAPDILTINNLYVHVTVDDILNRLRMELKYKNFDLVVLDALGDLLLDEINSQTAVRQFYNQLEKLIREFNTTFLLVHHVGKTPNRTGRANILGSVAIVDRARSALMLNKDSKTGLRWLTIVKSNNISDELKNKPIFLKFDEDTLIYSVLETDKGLKYINPKMSNHSEFDKLGKLVSSEVRPIMKVVKGKPGRKFDYNKFLEAKKLRAQGMNLDEIGEILGKHKSTISRWFKDHPTYDLSKGDGD